MPVGKLTKGYAPVVNGAVIMPVCETTEEATTKHPGKKLDRVYRSRHSDLITGRSSPTGKRWTPET